MDFSFDGLNTSFSPLKDANFKAEVKVSQGTLVLYGIQKEPFVMAPQIQKKHVSLLKSNLQKCVRRKDSDRAIRTAMALFSYSPSEALRRIPIVMIEDTLPHPESFCLLVWWMCAVSKGYKLSQQEVSSMLGIVYMMCQTTVFEPFHSHHVGRGELTLSKNTPEGKFLQCLDLRKQYRGMKVDGQMLEYHIDLWTARFAKFPTGKPNAWYDLISAQEEFTVSEEDVKIPFSKDDILPEAVDYHCYTGILKDLPPGSHVPIWMCRSRINLRTPLSKYNIASPEIWAHYRKIEEKVEKYSQWIIKRLEFE
jgi:hypothetical protein